MNRLRLLALTCALSAPLLIAACGNRGPLVLPEDAPPPMQPPAEQAAPSDAATDKDEAGR
ncbi:LPS translocon maturation chaperone LptM [Aquimonas voraii]|nr:lipoprotein [Aquimonas voraii]